jgi:hypothetical protein
MTETTEPGGDLPAPADTAVPDRLPSDGQSITARRAITAPATVDRAARTVEVVWSTGARARNFVPSLGGITEELDMSPNAVRMAQLGSGNAPVLNMTETTPETPAAPPAPPAASPPATITVETPPDLEALRGEAQRAERERISGIDGAIEAARAQPRMKRSIARPRFTSTPMGCAGVSPVRSAVGAWSFPPVALAFWFLICARNCSTNQPPRYKPAGTPSFARHRRAL